MNKKLLYTGCAAALLLTTACSEDIAPLSEQESLVNFTVELPAEVLSRAYGEVSEPRTLQYQVFAKDGESLTPLTSLNESALPSPIVFSEGQLTKTIQLRLANSRTYAIVFWAAHQDAPYRFDHTSGSVTINYDAPNKPAANSDIYDAFYARKDVSVTGTINEPVELRRPFAQINIGATDWQDAAAAGWETVNTSVKVDDVYSTLNLLTGDVSAPVAGGYTYTLAAKPAGDNATFPITTAPVAEYQSMVYVLTGADQSLVNVDFTAQAGTEIVRNYANVPIQRNYRTNIYGRILTEEANFTINIEPAFAGSHNEEVVEVNTEAELRQAIAQGAEVVQVNNDIHLDQTLSVNNDIRLIGAGVGASAARSRVATGEVTITGKPIYINTPNAYFEGITFNNGTVAQESSIYATGDKAKDMTFINCTFTNAYWDALQITDQFDSLIFRNCYFHNTAEVQHGHRYIHVEPDSRNTTGKVEITDCVFENVSETYCHDSAITILSMYGENMTFANNLVKGDGEVNNTTFCISISGSVYSNIDKCRLYNSFAKYVASSESELRSLIGSGVNHAQLTADVTLSAPLNAPADAFVVDLNGHTLTCSNTNCINASDGTIYFGYGRIKNVSSSATHPGIYVNSTESKVGQLYLYHVNCETDQTMVNIGGKGQIRTYYSNFNCGYYGIATNASSAEQKPYIYISFCKFNCSDPVFVNVPCSLTIYDSELTGSMHGLVVRGGTATVTRTTITLDYPGENAADFAGMAHYFNSRNWGSGNMVNLAALTIGNKGTNAYQYKSYVSLKDCTVKCEGQSADYFPAVYAIANQGEGIGITFKDRDGSNTFTSNVGPIVYDKMAGAQSSNIFVTGASGTETEVIVE